MYIMDITYIMYIMDGTLKSVFFVSAVREFIVSEYSVNQQASEKKYDHILHDLSFVIVWRT